MSVGRICCREVDLVSPQETVTEAAQRMGERGVGTLVVLDEGKRPLGLVTDRDLVVRVLAAGRDAGATPVGEIMTRAPKVVHEESAIEDALALMRAGSFRRLPVVDREGRLAGIVSVDDVLALLAEEFAHIGGVIERRKT